MFFSGAAAALAFDGTLKAPFFLASFLRCASSARSFVASSSSSSSSSP